MHTKFYGRLLRWFERSAIYLVAGFLFFSAFGGSALAQSRLGPADAKAGKLVDSFVRRKMAADQIPGLQIAVLRNGTLIKIANYGVSNVELKRPVTSETMFEIASNSKQFTAGGILLLAEDGKLSLDDSVTKYIKGFSTEYDQVTIRQLLNHTSGVKDYIEEFDLNRKLEYSNQELVERIAANGLNFAPGEGARYSTTGYLLLGIIIENITGKPYSEFFRERIFEPLGMRHTMVNNLAEVIAGRATGYVLANEKLRHGSYVGQTLRSSADIGLITTATDMAKWDLALSRPNIFSRQSLDQMFAPGKQKNGRYAYNDWNGYFGLGWFLDDYVGHREINHGGTLITGFHCNISRFVDKSLTVIVLTNRLRSNPAMLGYTIAGFYDASLRPPHLMQSKPDGNPQRTSRIRDLLFNAGNGSVDESGATAGFLSSLSSDNGPKSDIKNAFQASKTFSSISCENVPQRSVERIGSKIETICFYRINTKPQSHYLGVYLDSKERLADVWIYKN